MTSSEIAGCLPRLHYPPGLDEIQGDSWKDPGRVGDPLLDYSQPLTPVGAGQSQE